MFGLKTPSQSKLAPLLEKPEVALNASIDRNVRNTHPDMLESKKALALHAQNAKRRRRGVTIILPLPGIPHKTFLTLNPMLQKYKQFGTNQKKKKMYPKLKNLLNPSLEMILGILHQKKRVMMNGILKKDQAHDLPQDQKLIKKEPSEMDDTNTKLSSIHPGITAMNATC